MLYQGSVELPGGKKVYAEVIAVFIGTTRDWWEERGKYIINEKNTRFLWENKEELKPTDLDRRITVDYELCSRETTIREFVIEQVLIMGGEPDDAS